LKDEYTKKYGGDLDNDFLKLVKDPDSVAMSQFAQAGGAGSISNLTREHQEIRSKRRCT